MRVLLKGFLAATAQPDSLLILHFAFASSHKISCLPEPLIPASTPSAHSAPVPASFHFERCSQCPSVRSSLRCKSTPDSFTHSAIFWRKWLFNPIKTQKNTDHQGLLILSCCSKVFFNLKLGFVLTAQACLKEGIWLGLFGQPMTHDCDGCRHPRYNNNNCLSLSGGSLPAVF